jgi:hypothetical protein
VPAPALVGVTLLCKFCTRIEGLPQGIGEADESHPLAAFTFNPVGCVEEDEDAWEKFNGPLVISKMSHYLSCLNLLDK